MHALSESVANPAPAPASDAYSEEVNEGHQIYNREERDSDDESSEYLSPLEKRCIDLAEEFFPTTWQGGRKE